MTDGVKTENLCVSYPRIWFLSGTLLSVSTNYGILEAMRPYVTTTNSHVRLRESSNSRVCEGFPHLTVPEAMI